MNRPIVNLSIAVIALALTFQSCAPTLVEKGETDFKIVLADTPQPIEQTAAKELKSYLDAMTQINWVIASESEVPEDAPQILVGNSSRAKKLFPEIDPAQIPNDGIEIHLKGNKLLLTGHEKRGTLYAVNTFLEDILGVRWWTSTEQTIPTYETFKLKPIHISYAPKLIYRQAHYKDAYQTIFATRMKCNGSSPAIPPEYGGHHSFASGFVHTLFQLIPPQKYFAEHPEWFSEIDGVRKNEHPAQLCLTNEEVRKELTKNALEELRNHPDAKFISISQNDGSGACTCEKCSKVVEEEGSQSGPIIRFVNAVAEEIEKEFPDVFVETLAYYYTRKPPKYVKPRDNVVIRFCTYECSFVQPLTGEQNEALYNDIVSWSKISKQLFVWDYITNFSSYILPHPNLRVLAPNIRFFVDHGTIGLFEQGDAECAVGDFVRLRSWLISHLMWDPTLDEKKLTREFLTGYYGEKATPFLLEYFDLLLNKAESSGQFIGIYRENTDDWLDYETLCQATALFDQAITAAEKENDEFVGRLRRERLPLEHVWLKGYYKFKRHAEKNGQPFAGPPDPEEACRNFFDLCEKYQVTAHRECTQSRPFADYKDDMFCRFGKPAPLPEEFANLGSDRLMDVQEYYFNIMTTWCRVWASNVDDPAASNGRAVSIPGTHGEKAVRIPIPIDEPLFENNNADTKYKIVAYVRCDATVRSGLAMTCGINNLQKEIAVSEVAGSAYQKITFEPISLDRSTSIWFAPSRREEVQAIYIDRVLIIKE